MGIMKRVGTRVYGSGGVVTKVASFGNQELAYPIKRAGETFNDGEMWIMGFHAPTTFVKQLRKELSEDHRIIRQLVLKETRWPRLYYFSAEALQGVLAAQKTPEEFNLETGYYLEDNEEEDSDSSDSDSDSDSE